MRNYELICNIDAEPLNHYRPGGYHPLHIGDILGHGRYKILHKLGWGGHSTVWAARDQRPHECVALKVSVSKCEKQSREATTLRTIATTRSNRPGLAHLISTDHFKLEGSNGLHDCFALEMMGSSVPDVLEQKYGDRRLPGRLTKSIAKQTLPGLDHLHQQGIAFGDIHSRNLAFALPSSLVLNQENCLQKLKKHEIWLFSRKDGGALEPGVPKYIVRPSQFSVDPSSTRPLVKLVDFGESFLGTNVPVDLHTPLVIRAPEVIFGDHLDYRVDLWSMGCLLFEIVAGQPPFDNYFVTPSPPVEQMLDTIRDDLPERWLSARDTMMNVEARNEPGQTFQEWLEEVYFDEERHADFTREDILKVGQLFGKLLRFEPSARASARQILQDPWFQDDQVQQPNFSYEEC